ncbi:MAG: bifunctional biotin--[acetyl-CoA-carboxylase] ligase/biotin operon repressor BirA [Gammaproteobacteria bacterium]|nr:bifunctional biotin--[acetyl-CoA-carboxylase] ligase/biotin operon repressor BirA [Gammaproteobacteria bacterium]MBQ0841011.1 bifunctional biotin--[acetyl-CoA-carboxylase] ligase/biotin operon repressor BirA [Gammaproteobacteria bacterium]
MRDTCLRIVELLGDGEFVSGAVLGDCLGVSRTAVWKQLNKLEGWGVPIETVRGRGYRIPGGMELLDDDRILNGLAECSSRFVGRLEVLDATDSTNNMVRGEIEKGAPQGFVCFAERQTGGRGRHGREWVSPFGRNLYMSLSWHFDDGAAALEGLSLAVGVVVARVIQSFGVNNVALKWPNDILLDKQKVGGVLLEMMGDPVGNCQVIVGVGINLGMAEDTEIDQPWADLGRHGQISRNELASALLSELLPMLNAYSCDGFLAYRAEWQGFDAYRDSPIKLITPRMTVRGLGRGVSDTGAIQIEVDGVIEAYSGGEISLRSADDR